MKINRPLSPHLSLYKPQLTSIFSIFHRISGAFLAISILLVVFFFKISVLGLNYYSIYWFLFLAMSKFYWLLFSVLNLALLAFCYHVSNGIRHLLWDFGFFLDLPKVYATGTIMIICSSLLFALFCFLRISSF